MKVGQKYVCWFSVNFQEVFECIYVSSAGHAVLEDEDGYLRIIQPECYSNWIVKK